MSKESAEHHERAAEHHEHAARHHREAAKHEAGGEQEERDTMPTWHTVTTYMLCTMQKKQQKITPPSTTPSKGLTM
jgi:hypothetical protein